MHARIAAAVTLGVWLGITVALWWVPGANFRVLKPENLRNADVVYAKLPESDRGPALRYAASELNRSFFATYGVAQVALSGVSVALVIVARARGAQPGRLGVALLSAAIVLALGELAITPRIIELGRQIDFMPRDPVPPEVREFGLLHAIYVIADLVKALALAGAAATLGRVSSP